MSAAKNQRPFLAAYVAKYGLPKLDRLGRMRAARVKTCDCPHAPKTISDKRWHDSVYHKPVAR